MRGLIVDKKRGNVVKVCVVEGMCGCVHIYMVVCGGVWLWCCWRMVLVCSGCGAVQRAAMISPLSCYVPNHTKPIQSHHHPHTPTQSDRPPQVRQARVPRPQALGVRRARRRVQLRRAARRVRGAGLCDGRHPVLDRRVVPLLPARRDGGEIWVEMRMMGWWDGGDVGMRVVLVAGAWLLRGGRRGRRPAPSPPPHQPLQPHPPRPPHSHTYARRTATPRRCRTAVRTTSSGATCAPPSTSATATAP